MDLTLLLSPEAGATVAGAYLTTMFLKKQIEMYFAIKENKIWKRVILPWLCLLAAIIIGNFLGQAVIISLILGCATSLFYSNIKALITKSELLDLKNSVAPKKGNSIPPPPPNTPNV